MTSAVRLGLLGGTLDPTHFGHLDAAEVARQALALDEVWLVPSHDPPHRPADPVATSFHRFALAALAIVDRPQYRASDLELRRTGPSYTIDTLKELHAAGWSPSQIFFIIGVDAFADIPAWRAFPAVLDASNFIVVGRSGTAPAQTVSRVPGVAARVEAPTYRAAHPHDTKIFPVEGRTRDVSSSLIRTRLRSRQHIDDLVPAAVERHIMAHGLYGPVGSLHEER
jgi:nicotinate-nucleotide adenylyltransferase